MRRVYEPVCYCLSARGHALDNYRNSQVTYICNAQTNSNSLIMTVNL